MNTARIQADGRWIVIVCLVLYFAPLLSGGQLWTWMGVPQVGSPAFPFRDLHCFVAGADSMAAGYDPIKNNIYDATHLPANYPYISFWFLVFAGIHLNAVNGLGVCLAVSFYAGILLYMGRLRMVDGLVWSVLLCLPPAMLAVERGNNDLVIFGLLVVALLCRRHLSRLRQSFTYPIILLCAMLKLFPIAALALAIREKPRTAITVLITSMIVFGAYVYLVRAQIAEIRSVLPNPHDFAYGRRVFIDRYNVEHEHQLSTLLGLAAMSGCALFAFGAAYFFGREDCLSQQNADGLIVGGALYATTFALGSNYNYRLIFLLLAIPAFLELLHSSKQQRALAAIVLIAIFFGWALSCEVQRDFFLVKEAANWLMFMGVIFFCATRIFPKLRLGPLGKLTDRRQEETTGASSCPVLRRSSD